MQIAEDFEKEREPTRTVPAPPGSGGFRERKLYLWVRAMSAHVLRCVSSSLLGNGELSGNRWRAWAAGLLGGVSVLLFTGDLFAQDSTKPVKDKHPDIVLTTKDNWEIHISYFQSGAGKETPVVVLLHRERGNRRVWLGKGGFAERLHNLNYAVIAVDLRKHGQSVSDKKDARSKISNLDRQKMVQFDMEAVKQFIFKEHMAKRLNMNKMAMIAPEMSAAVAVNYTTLDWSKKPHDDGIGTPRGQDIRALILLSPQRNPRGLSTGKALGFLGKLASNSMPAFQFSMLFSYGTGDRMEKRSETKRMYNVVASVKGSKDRVALKPYAYSYRGTDLIGKNNRKTHCEEHMLGFLNDRLQKLTQTPWRDRRSRFNRN